MTGTFVIPPAAHRTVVLRDVTVVDTADGSHTAHQDITVVNGLIASISETRLDESKDSADNTQVDLAGRFVVPGFIDSHAHPLNHPDQVEGAYALMFVNGIVGYRQMSGGSQLLADRAAGRLPVFQGAPALLATCGDLLTPMNAATSEAAREVVSRQQAEGADFIKAAITTPESHIAALQEARRCGIPLVGHLPEGINAREVSALGMRSIEHLGPGVALFEATASKPLADDGLAEAPRIPKLPNIAIPGVDRVLERIIANIVVNPSTRTSPASANRFAALDAAFSEEKAHALARAFVANETWQCPTLIRMHTQQMPWAPEHSADVRARYMAPSALSSWRKSTRKFLKLPQSTRDILFAHWDVQLRLTKILDDESVPMLAGTDSTDAAWVIPGFALHDEFDLLASAGLSPLRILQMATIAPARFFGLADTAGQVVAGSNADLVVLEADPVADHRNLHAIGGVMRGGGWWSRNDLDEILARAGADPRAF